MRNMHAWLLGATLCAGLAAGADAATVGIGGTCYHQCSGVGLADGDAVGGTIDIDDAFYAQDGFSGIEALKSYSFSFGNFSLSSTDKPDPEFQIGWGSVPRTIFNLSLSAFLSNDPGNPGRVLVVFAGPDFAGNGTASNDGWRREIPGCCFETSFGTGGELSFDPIAVVPAPAPIPVPAAG